MSDSKPRISTVYAILVIDSNVLSVNILKMFVTDIRKEFYEVVANQVRTSSLASLVSLTTVEYLIWSAETPVRPQYCIL